MTLDDAALEIAKDAWVSALVYARYTTPFDALDSSSVLPTGYVQHPMVDRAREMLKAWDKYTSPEIEKEIADRAEQLQANWRATHADPEYIETACATGEDLFRAREAERTGVSEMEIIVSEREKAEIRHRVESAPERFLKPWRDVRQVLKENPQ